MNYQNKFLEKSILITHRIKVLILSAICAIPVFAGEYVVDREAKNEVKFISKATWEDFEGVTKHIDGYVYWEGDDLTDKSELYFEVELNTVETGNGKRDRDMRDDYLHTNRYPYTHYTGNIFAVEDSTEKIIKIFSSGIMYIHGVEKSIKVNAIMEKEEQGYKLNSNFIVELSDYNIKIPKLMMFKIDEKMKIQLTFFVKKI